MQPGEGEPAAASWRVEPLSTFAAYVVHAAGTKPNRPTIVAVDGRSSSGKSTLATRLQRVLPQASLVHTDDIAWWHAAFAWTDLLVNGVLRPLHNGEPVRFRPPQWDERGRPGAIEVAADARVVIVEGVGAGRRELTPWLDAVVWVQSDQQEIDRRNDRRVAAGEMTPSAFAQWMSEEVPFVAEERTWERTVAIVAGTPDLPHDPVDDVVVADVVRTAP